MTLVHQNYWNKNVYHIKKLNLILKLKKNSECGLQTTRKNSNSIEGLNKLATNGDWPWYAALFKNGIHSCDATLISDSWLLTTVSCFQGYIFCWIFSSFINKNKERIQIFLCIPVRVEPNGLQDSDLWGCTASHRGSKKGTSLEWSSLRLKGAP